MLATDPDADRVGIAMECPDGSYELVTGNEVGVLLLDYIAAGRIEKGTMPKDPVAVKSIVSTPLADAVAAHYGVEMRNVLTGFKWIGDQIAQLEEDMHKMQERMDMDATYRPVVLLEKKYAVYLEAGENVLEALQPTEKERSLIVDNAKLLLIGEFMDAYGYEKTFENEKFVIFE